MIKKFLCGAVIVITVCFIGVDLYQNFKESRQPVLVFVEEKLRTSTSDQINGYQYVLTAQDHNGNDILDTEHLSFEQEKEDKSQIKIHYTLKDDEGNILKKIIVIQLEESVEYAPNGTLQGTGTDQKESKIFYLKDYDNNPVRTMSEADQYGYSSSQKYEVKQKLNEQGDLEGYECVIEN